jgi:hypothetical protein
MSKKWQPRRVAAEKGTPVRLACKPLKNRGGRHVYAGPMQVCMQVAVSCVRNHVLLDVEKRGNVVWIVKRPRRLELASPV